MKKITEKFEHTCCSLCNSNDYRSLYQTTLLASEVIGKVDIQLVICNECGFIYQNPQLTQGILDLHYQNHSSGSTFHLLSENSRHNILLDERQAFINANIPSIEQGAILDIGGGQGDLISSLNFPESVSKYLIEPSDAINQVTNEHVNIINDKIENLVSSNLPAPDLILCISVLEHLKKPDAILNSFSKLLKENGYLVLEVPNSQTPYLQLAEFYSYEHINHFTEYTLNKFLTNNNFIIVATDCKPSIPNIRIIAKKMSKDHNFKMSCDTFDEYISAKKDFFQRTFKKITTHILDKNIEGFSIYGAGDHTRSVLEKFNFLDKVESFVDSDEKKSGTIFFNKPIISPSEIKNLKYRTILISSHDFENEIFSTIRKHDDSIEIITIYNESK